MALKISILKINGSRKKLKVYKNDLKESFRFIFRSNRMRAFVFFQIVFYSLICVMDTYDGDLLIRIGIREEQFSMIFAVLTLIRGVSLSFKRTIEKKFKNRTLTFISLMYISACITIGVTASKYHGKEIIPIILIMYAIKKIFSAIWYIFEAKYLKNFTSENGRSRITFAYEFVGGVAASIFCIFNGLILKIYNIENAYLIIGLISLASIIVVLDYMRKRFGLKPEEYRKEDIEF